MNTEGQVLVCAAGGLTEADNYRGEKEAERRTKRGKTVLHQDEIGVFACCLSVSLVVVWHTLEE